MVDGVGKVPPTEEDATKDPLIDGHRESRHATGIVVTEVRRLRSRRPAPAPGRHVATAPPPERRPSGARGAPARPGTVRHRAPPAAASAPRGVSRSASAVSRRATAAASCALRWCAAFPTATASSERAMTMAATSARLVLAASQSARAVWAASNPSSFGGCRPTCRGCVGRGYGSDPEGLHRLRVLPVLSTSIAGQRDSDC